MKLVSFDNNSINSNALTLKQSCYLVFKFSNIHFLFVWMYYMPSHHICNGDYIKPNSAWIIVIAREFGSIQHSDIYFS